MVDTKRALGVALLNMMLNALLAVGKLVVGVLTSSQALFSDGVHGAADVVSAAAVMIGLRLSAKRSDEQYAYGYERMECVAALLLSLMIGMTGVGLVLSGLEALACPTSTEAAGTAVTVAVLSLAFKEWMFRRTKREADRMGSPALTADAWHQRADVFASIGTLVGVSATALGWQAADALTTCVIGGCILHTAVSVFADAIRNMTDHAADDETERRIAAVAADCSGICRVCRVRTRLFGSRVMAEVTVAVDGAMTADEAYTVRCGIEAAVEETVPPVKECFVRIHPIAVANRA